MGEELKKRRETKILLLDSRREDLDCLSEALREKGLRADESQFALLLPGTGSEGVPAVRSRLKSSFQRSPMEFHGRWMKTPISLGAASFPEVVGTAQFMLTAALEDLRRSRETQGRNRAALIA